MNRYTVLLLRPDYAASTFGQDTYLAHVLADNVDTAQVLAQREAYTADVPLLEEDHDDGLKADYYVLAVFDGHLSDLKVDDVRPPSNEELLALVERTALLDGSESVDALDNLVAAAQGLMRRQAIADT